jgi:hypothetical protein
MQSSLGPEASILAGPLPCLRCEPANTQMRIGAVDVLQGNRVTRLLPQGGMVTATSEDTLGSRVLLQMVCRVGHKSRLVVEPLLTGEVHVAHKI